MSVNNKNFFELCNDVLDELYYEQVESFDELDELTEGRKVKKMLNRALVTICNNENENWQFKEVDEPIILVAGQEHYNRPNGYIRWIKRHNENYVLNYIEDSKWVPEESTGTPVSYWMDGERIRLFPIPDKTAENMQLDVHLLTNNYATDCMGVGKLEMECECDVPIIPNKHRQILIWRVCADWRANDADAKSQYYDRKYREAYRAMKVDCLQTEDYPSGLNIDDTPISYKDIMLDIFKNPYTIRRKS